MSYDAAYRVFTGLYAYFLRLVCFSPKGVFSMYVVLRYLAVDWVTKITVLIRLIHKPG